MLDGKSLLRSLRELLNEQSDSEFLDDRTSYEYLWQASIEFAERTNALTKTQTLTTSANQAEYTLNANYMGLYLKNQDENYYIKYNDGSADTFILFREKEDVIYQNSTSSVTVPSHFYIEDDPTLDTQISSTATSAGTSTGGQATLTDSTAPFADVSAGDIVHNTTDGSDGYVLSKTSDSALVTALFDGTDNDWTNLDSYIIQPQSRLRLVLNQPPSTSAHTATVYYRQRPEPVFSDYGIYRIPQQYLQSLVFYACWLYKYRDRAPNYGDRYFQFFDRSVKRSNTQLNRSMNRRGFKVNLKNRNRGFNG